MANNYRTQVGMLLTNEISKLQRELTQLKQNNENIAEQVSNPVDLSIDMLTYLSRISKLHANIRMVDVL